MLEINQEVMERIGLTLSTLEDICKYRLKFKLPLRVLSPSIFISENNSTIDEWSVAVISAIFSQTIISESSNLYTGENAIEIINRYEPSTVKDHYIDGVNSFESIYGNGEGEATELYLKKREKFIKRHMSMLEIGSVTFKSYLFTRDILQDNSCITYIPFYIIDKFNLSDKYFLAADIDDDLNFTVYYFNNYCSDFIENISQGVEIDDALMYINSLIDSVESEVDVVC